MNDIVCGPFLDFRVWSKRERPVSNDVTYCFCSMIFDGDNFTEGFKI